MSRASRHSRIIEIISNNEIETQEELVKSLKDTGLDITQATVSRDIKDLGLIKIAGSHKRYKYALIDSDTCGTNKIPNIFRESVLSTTIIPNMVVVKIVRGTAGLVASYINKMNLDNCLGTVYGDDTVLVIANNNAEESIREKITNAMESNNI